MTARDRHGIRQVPGANLTGARASSVDRGPAADATENLMTVEEVTRVLHVARATYYRWRQRGAAPPDVRLPNGQLRIHPADLRAWLTTRTATPLGGDR